MVTLKTGMGSIEVDDFLINSSAALRCLSGEPQQGTCSCCKLQFATILLVFIGCCWELQSAQTAVVQMESARRASVSAAHQAPYHKTVVSIDTQYYVIHALDED